MTQARVLSNDLVRRLIGVGQVDIVVGLPTLNHADTIADTLDVIDVGLTRYFPRARTVVIGADGGSKDRTLDIVSDSPLVAAGARASALRTRHRIGVSYRGVPDRAGAIKLIFTAADLLQAQSVAICDPDASGFSPDWLGALLEPIARQSFDLVASVYVRHPLEGLLVTQLIRPVMRAAYGRPLEQPLLGVFACSRRFAAGCLARDVWDRSPICEGIDVWLAATALSGDYQAGQAALGRFPVSRRPVSLQSVFSPLVGTLFATLDEHAATWIHGAPVVPVPTFGRREEPAPDGHVPSSDSSGPAVAFLQGARDVLPVLKQILAADTFASVCAITDTSADAVRYDDNTWIATVYDFVGAHHHGVIDRTHIVQALMPLYLGRVASFISEHAQSSVAQTEQSIEQLSQQFVRQRPYLIERWQRTT